jgi:hypothetical protein
MKKSTKAARMYILMSALLISGGMVAWAQMKGDVNSSAGNAELMRHNLNEPNAVNPAMNNNQNYERKHSPPIETSHPDVDLANKYSRKMYQK